MAYVRIVRLLPEDLAFAKGLTDAEEWHRTTRDWQRLLGLEPGGAFKALVDGRDAGTAAAVVYDRMAWVHSVIVREPLQGRGIGAALMQACMGYLWKDRGVSTVKLDSVAGMESFYERFGFRPEYPSWRFIRGGVETPATAARMRTADHADVFAFDRRHTGLDRRRVLAALLADEPEGAFLVREHGRVRGYVLVRTGEWRDPIGPCVADPEDLGVAADLLKAALSRSPGRTYRMCVGGGNEPAVKLAEELGFNKGDHSTRMYAGQPFSESAACIAMISAEKG